MKESTAEGFRVPQTASHWKYPTSIYPYILAERGLLRTGTQPSLHPGLFPKEIRVNLPLELGLEM